MPTRKQRRRRDKERRHEWEEVYLDDEGREIPAEEAELLEAERRRQGRENGRGPARARSAGRAVEPPSWRRVAKRGLFFAPVMFLVLTFLDPDTTVAARLLYTLQLMVLFVPFSYIVDSFTYRMYRRRVGEGPGVPPPR